MSAYESIRGAIVEGRYRPGDRLVEQRVAEELALSRTPVREAFRMLQTEGLVLGVGLGEPPSEYTALGRTADRAALAAMLDESLEVLSGLWSGRPFSHHGAHYSFDEVQFLPPALQEPRIPVWVSAMARNERTLGRAARWDGVVLGAMTAEGGMDVLPPAAVAEVTARPDAPADIVVAAPAGTDPAVYEDAGATWVLLTPWLDELRGLATAPPPGSAIR